MNNNFGGSWTDRKMEIVESYAKAYLKIFSNQPWAKTMYFDGFAGSGVIAEDDAETGKMEPLWLSEIEDKEDVKKGTALRILDIIDPRPFDIYYFVEKNEAHMRALKARVDEQYPARGAFVVHDDCNKKLSDMAAFLRKEKNYRCLAFIDPYGMSVKWLSIEELKGLGVDLWILVPTGVGANRVLATDANIPDGWWTSLETFLGMTRDHIKKSFYRQVTSTSLFAEEATSFVKEADSVNKLGKLYADRLRNIFTYVSDLYVLKNSMNSIMYHFMMATNNATALKIANEVIRPKYKM